MSVLTLHAHRRPIPATIIMMYPSIFLLPSSHSLHDPPPSFPLTFPISYVVCTTPRPLGVTPACLYCKSPMYFTAVLGVIHSEVSSLHHVNLVHRRPLTHTVHAHVRVSGQCIQSSSPISSEIVLYSSYILDPLLTVPSLSCERPASSSVHSVSCTTRMRVRVPRPILVLLPLLLFSPLSKRCAVHLGVQL